MGEETAAQIEQKEREIEALKAGRIYDEAVEAFRSDPENEEKKKAFQKARDAVIEARQQVRLNREAMEPPPGDAVANPETLGVGVTVETPGGGQ
jgi:hypothetical protein